MTMESGAVVCLFSEIFKVGLGIYAHREHSIRKVWQES